MKVNEIGLVWIVVKDLKKAIKFYTEVVGLKLEVESEQYPWAELSGYKGGARLGIAQEAPEEAIRPGQNGVVTFTVDNLAEAKKKLLHEGVKTFGEEMEVPGHVKMQTCLDRDGNHFQLVELL